MMCPQHADGEDSLQIWIGAVNKWLGTANKGLGQGLTTPDLKKLICYEMLHRTSDLDGFFGTTSRVQWWTLVNMIMNFWVP
jgi:hypothetical protein